MEKKFTTLLKFPCTFTYKVIGLSQPELTNNIVKIIQHHVPGDYAPQIKPSNEGIYLSISITIFAKNFKQIEKLYKELIKIHLVKMVF
ncbi:DUF493 family protein YbeD [Buchnera aphidicola]|uniref:DUF493 family protein YbeD n=1 Tax=Buchnera aphidicola TaxID=9 RepID=UPI00094D96D4|nr:DUF493 family protein YbeD [Buchnera aphidicola]